MLLRQGTRSIEDYVVDFLELAHLTHSDEICLMIFCRGGLSEPLSSIMPLHDPNWTLEKYIDTALGLCDMDKKYISRFLDFFFRFRF